jgi:tetratricopeptide (TPR) repeat protein
MPLLFLLSVLATPPDAPLERGEKLLAAGDCEGLQALFAPSSTPRAERGTERGTERPIDAARLLVRGATACRKQDKVLAFALTQRAVELAPSDYGVRTALAESLISLDERASAAQLLDEVLQAHPKDAVRARFLRAQLADAESEHALAVRLLEPLLQEPEYAEPTRALLTRNQAALQDRAQARDTLAREEQAAQQAAARAHEVASSRTLPEQPNAPRSGTEAWSTRGTLKSGGARTFRTKNIQAGATYIFHATGRCTPPAQKKGRKSRLGPTVDLFGQDFRVRIGSLEPLPLKVGLEPEQNALSFQAPGSNPQIFIEDRTEQRADRPRCTISDVAVRVP